MKKYLKGQLLVDDGKLRGSFFHRTVILVCQHDAEGAFGLVLNRTTNHTVGDALTAQLTESLRQQPLLLGGPVQPQAMTYLHTDLLVPDANVLPNLRMDQSLDTLLEIGESFSPTRQIRVFAGYAGWSPGQLETEMRRQTWLTHPARIDHVFHPDPTQLWKAVLAEKGWKYRIMADGPEDLSWN